MAAETPLQKRVPHFVHEDRDEHHDDPDQRLQRIGWTAAAQTKQHRHNPKPRMDADRNAEQAKVQITLRRRWIDEEHARVEGGEGEGREPE